MVLVYPAQRLGEVEVVDPVETLLEVLVRDGQVERVAERRCRFDDAVVAFLAEVAGQDVGPERPARGEYPRRGVLSGDVLDDVPHVSSVACAVELGCRDRGVARCP